MRKQIKTYIRESAKRRRVLMDCDVVIAGSGLSSTFAAIAAGRSGARTIVVERMPMLGGNIGPGMFCGAAGLTDEADVTIPGGMTGIPLEFIQRVKTFQVGPEYRYPEAAMIVAQVAFTMMKEAGVDVLLDTYASDPIMQGKTVKGLFVECEGGRSAIRAKVTIDGTGDAEIAQRAGAPIIPYLKINAGQGVDPRYKTPEVPEGMIRAEFMNKAYPTYYNETALVCLVANISHKSYINFIKKYHTRLSAADRSLADKHFRHLPKTLWPMLVKAWRRKEKLSLWRTMPDYKIFINIHPFKDYGGVFGMGVSAKGAIDPSNHLQISALQGELRSRAFEALVLLRQGVAGFEKAYLLNTAMYLGFRGGPHIDAEHTLTVEEVFRGARFDDVLYRNIHEMNHGGDKSGFDVPYRCVLPKKIDGLLVCGRGAGYQRRGHDPTGMRLRASMMILGQAVGTAAAMAARSGVTPKQINIRRLQKCLVKAGLVLGDKERLNELGIV